MSTRPPGNNATSRARLALGNAAVLSPAEAAKLVGGTTARAWLEEQGLVRFVPGLGERVVWGDVVERMREVAAKGDPPRPPAPARPKGLRMADYDHPRHKAARPG